MLVYVVPETKAKASERVHPVLKADQNYPQACVKLEVKWTLWPLHQRFSNQMARTIVGVVNKKFYADKS